MILVGNSRANGQNLAHHLMSSENERVTIHEMTGFASDNLPDAFKEAEATSRATRCKKYLFSLSLNPPANETVKTEVFEDAILRAETTLGLSGQPRATVFHEKQGQDGEVRRHCHVVWSRIDTNEMKAVPMDYSKRKLFDLAKDLYLEHEWDMPKGFINPALRDDKNLTLSEWQQAKRFGQNPHEMKAAFREAWQRSDNKESLSSALAEHGLVLAKGDQRGYVATDMHGKVYPLARWSSVKTKDVRARLGDAKQLPSLEDARTQLSERLDKIAKRLQREEREKLEQLKSQQVKEQEAAKQKADAQRRLQAEWQKARTQKEERRRAERFNKGARGLIDRVTGQHAKTKEQNKLEAYRKAKRDQSQRDALIEKQQCQTSRLEALRKKQLEKPRAIAKELRDDRDRLADLRKRSSRDVEGRTPRGMDGPER